ncbi:MAG TPA: sterol desaturase family protein [Methylocella sp.]|nr:sterol desaturase family protein [Methylocella sp.]
MSESSSIENYFFAVAAALFLLLLLIERWRPHTRHPSSRLKKSFSTNTMAFTFNSIVMNLLSVSSLLVVAENYSHHGLLSGMSDGLLKWIISFICFDFAVYAWHYFGHKSQFLWRLHKVHHSDKSFHVTTGLRFHVFDQLLEVIFKCICTIVIGVPAKIVFLCEIVRMLFVLFHHANATFPGEKWLSYIFITPSLHRVHHSALRAEHDSNYGIVLAVWDLIFRTRKELVPEKIGLELIEAEDFFQLFALAFLTERRLARVLHLLPRRRKRF